jgi:hypothetical protein
VAAAVGADSEARTRKPNARIKRGACGSLRSGARDPVSAVVVVLVVVAAALVAASAGVRFVIIIIIMIVVVVVAIVTVAEPNARAPASAPKLLLRRYHAPPTNAAVAAATGTRRERNQRCDNCPPFLLFAVALGVAVTVATALTASLATARTVAFALTGTRACMCVAPCSRVWVGVCAATGSVQSRSARARVGIRGAPRGDERVPESVGYRHALVWVQYQRASDKVERERRRRRQRSRPRAPRGRWERDFVKVWHGCGARPQPASGQRTQRGVCGCRERRTGRSGCCSGRSCDGGPG